MHSIYIILHFYTPKYTQTPSLRYFNLIAQSPNSSISLDNISSISIISFSSFLVCWCVSIVPFFMPSKLILSPFLDSDPIVLSFCSTIFSSFSRNSINSSPMSPYIFAGDMYTRRSSPQVDAAGSCAKLLSKGAALIGEFIHLGDDITANS
eukprot:c14100_g1_i2 orf=1-453(+)